MATFVIVHGGFGHGWVGIPDAVLPPAGVAPDDPHLFDPAQTAAILDELAATFAASSNAVGRGNNAPP